MAKKKELEQEKLDYANGGIVQYSDTITCANCHYCGSRASFSQERVSESCETKTKFTCPNCGHTMTD